MGAQRRWAVENARGLGRHLTQWLVARGEAVMDVPCTATARVRELSRGGRRKNDVIDAAAAASVAALQGDANPGGRGGPVHGAEPARGAPGDLAAARTGLVNQLHALLRDLIPGGAGTRPHLGRRHPAAGHGSPRLPGRTRPQGPRLADVATQMTATLAEHDTRLPEVDGIGPVLAARIVGRAGDATRFPTAAAFASCAAVAPIEVASGDHQRHRLSRSGDRQLNCALHLVAVTQVRMPNSAGRAYYDAKRAAHKTHNEAMRCLKRRLANHVWRLMISDHRRRAQNSPQLATDAA